MSNSPLKVLFSRYAGATEDMFTRIFTPYRLRLERLWQDKESGRPMFEAKVPADVAAIFEEGTTGKVVPRLHVEGELPWREIIKGRISSSTTSHVQGELYFAPARLRSALGEVREGDYLEIDPFGIASAISSALCEATFFRIARESGFSVIRMPANVAKSVGTQNHYDFRLERSGKVYRVELKSLWGTDTTKARLIHTKSRLGEKGKNSQRTDRQIWETSSCRFSDQDIFAVSLWLRTGRVDDFAFALSAPMTEEPTFGLPPVEAYPKHVTQNPEISHPPSGAWVTDLQEAIARVDGYRAKRKISEVPPDAKLVIRNGEASLQ